MQCSLLATASGCRKGRRAAARPVPSPASLPLHRGTSWMGMSPAADVTSGCALKDSSSCTSSGLARSAAQCRGVAPSSSAATWTLVCALRHTPRLMVLLEGCTGRGHTCLSVGVLCCRMRGYTRGGTHCGANFAHKAQQSSYALVGDKIVYYCNHC